MIKARIKRLSGLSPIRRAAQVLALTLLTAFFAPGIVEAESQQRLPVISMLEISGVTPTDPELYQAIRAQLSGAPLILGRIEIEDGSAFGANPQGLAAKSATESASAMVFWIEDRETCRLFFYIPDPSGGRINSRTLVLERSNSWSRFQTIAIAAASMVEGLLVRHRIRAVPEPPPPPPPQASAPEPAGNPDRRFEIFAAYAGALFAENTVTHGACLGFGVRPTSFIVLAASFTQNGPVAVRTEEYELDILSRNVEVSLAGRLRRKRFELRLGIAWSVDLRSFSSSFSAETVDGVPDGFHSVQTILPFIAAAWRFTERIGLFTRIGANIALNETAYKIDRLETDTEELLPFRVKLAWQLGLMFHI